MDTAVNTTTEPDYGLTLSQYKKWIANTRRDARRAGWSLKKVDAAECCAHEWANATQNTRRVDWNDAEWRRDSASHFAEITDGVHDGVWEQCAGIN